MKLKEVDWNAPSGATEIEVEYSDAPIQEFMNWLRRTSAWKENGELVEVRLRKLNRGLIEEKNAAQARAATPPAAAVPTPAPKRRARKKPAAAAA